MPSDSISMIASKSLAVQIAIRIGAADQLVEIVFLPVLASGRFGDNLLRQDVERRSRGISSRSSSPERMARTSAAHSISSSRVVAKRRPFGLAPTQCPERPTRCSATAMDRGDPIWQTRSTEPMSMPSSSDAVATTARSSPFFSRASASSRSARERLP